MSDVGRVVRYLHNPAPIACREKFLFRGIKGQAVEAEKIVEIISISVSGNVSYFIHTDGKKSDHIFGARYEQVLRMIEHAIWLPLERGASELYEVTDVPDAYAHPS